MEIKSKLTVTRGEGGNGAKKGKGHQGTAVKDPQRQQGQGRIGCGRWGWVGRRRVMEGNGDNRNYTDKKSTYSQNWGLNKLMYMMGLKQYQACYSLQVFELCF